MRYLDILFEYPHCEIEIYLFRIEAFSVRDWKQIEAGAGFYTGFFLGGGGGDVHVAAAIVSVYV